MTEVKTCQKCGNEFPIEDFWKIKNGRYRSRSCRTCKNIQKRNKAPRWVSRRTDLHLCTVCQVNPRLSYHHYCHQCKSDYQKATRLKRWKERHPNYEARRIENARQYATGLLRRGKIKRGPCVFCGKPGKHFHHYDYEKCTMNFDNVCLMCHVQIHGFLNALLTIYRKLM
jgi:hypothetical protein